MFPNLKMIKIILGVYELEEADSCLEALNDLRVLEENDIVKFIVVDMNEHVACHSNVEGCRVDRDLPIRDH